MSDADLPQDELVTCWGCSETKRELVRALGQQLELTRQMQMLLLMEQTTQRRCLELQGQFQARARE